MDIIYRLSRSVLLTVSFIATLLFQVESVAQTPSGASSKLPATMAKTPQFKDGLASFAKASGFTVCARELDSLDRSLFRDSEYSLRAFFAERDTDTKPFSALIDSRKIDAQRHLTRALTNIVVTPGDAKSPRCSVMYEQTLYHEQHCDNVRSQMAEFAPESGATSFGSITFDLLRNMTLTIIPVGNSQCVSVLKEVSF